MGFANRLGHAQLALIEEQNEHRTRIDEGATALGHQFEDSLDVALAAELAAQRSRGLEAAHRPLEVLAARLCLLIEPRVVDRDRRPLG